MSLLMDALKKAEQEKKDAAKRLEEAGSVPALERTGEHPADVTSENPAGGSVPAPRAADEGGHLSLTPLEGDSTAVMPVPPQPAATPVLDLSSEDNVPDETPSSESREPEPEQEAVPEQPERDPDQTFHGVALAEPESMALYEATIQGEELEASDGGKGYEETLPGVPAAQLARDIGTPDQPTPVAAQTVFAAGESRRAAAASGRWNLVYLGIATVIIAAGGVFYYYSVTPVARKLPSPWVARGIETVVQPGEIAGVPVTPPPGTESAAATEGQGAVTPQPAQTGTPVPAAPTGGAEVPQSQAGPAQAEAPPAVTVSGEAVPSMGEPGVSEASIANAPPATPESPRVSPAPVEFGAPPSLIQIQRTSGPSETGTLVQQAYASFKAGKFEDAEQQYQAVLSKHPDNIDALLGTGAIAMRNQDVEKALLAYARVLRLDPRNETALAAMVGLQKNADLGTSESALKFMLQQHPDDPYLNYTLGTVYAAQRRWPEAQQAFFDAYRNDSSNPDFALNLAVSLDHIGQRETALDYYDTALKLADERPAAFDSSAVMARVQALSAPSGH